MIEAPKRSLFSADGVAVSLRHTVFRRIWLASLLSNLGLMIQGVSAAWAMTQMTSSADKVALVQTALMLPIMLISMPAGAVADMYDRRIVALRSLSIALTGATALSVLAWLGVVTPEILLGFCFIVGSGPLVVQIEYRVGQHDARAFHDVMQEVQRSRQRNGAYGWSIARDIADPELWTERYHCRTWLDYLRQRNRSSRAERALHQRAMDFHLGPELVRIRRMLERPVGSVCWKEELSTSAAGTMNIRLLLEQRV